MPDSRAAEFLQLARDLEERDLELAARIDGVSALLREVDGLKARAARVRHGLDEIPGEIRQAEVDERDARVREAAALEELAAAERAHDEAHRSRKATADARERADRAMLRAEVAAADATMAVVRARHRLEDAVREEAVLQSEAEGLEVEARELARTVAEEPRLSESGRSAPGSSLAAIDEWGARAHAALFVVRGGLESERERLVVEANALAAVLLGDHGGGASVSLVRQRIEANQETGETQERG
jgi:hypothetical protein